MFKKNVTSVATIVFFCATIAPVALAQTTEYQGINYNKLDRPTGGVLRSGYGMDTSLLDCIEIEPLTVEEYTDDEIIQELKAACEERKEKIPTAHFDRTAGEVANLCCRVAMLYPKLLLKTQYGYYSEGGRIDALCTAFVPEYLFEDSKEHDSAVKYMENKIANYADGARKIDDPLEQMLYVHDAIIKDTTYGYISMPNVPVYPGDDATLLEIEKYQKEAEEYLAETSFRQGICHHAYGLLKNGVAVCQGYAQTFYMVMCKLGYTADTVNFAMYDDPVDSAKNHMWNYVQVDGTWYHVDLTWDDQGDKGFFYHCFLTSDAVFTSADATRNHGDPQYWSSYVGDGKPRNCNSDRFAYGYVFNFMSGMPIEWRGANKEYVGVKLGETFYYSDSLYNDGLFVTHQDRDCLLTYLFPFSHMHHDVSYFRMDPETGGQMKTLAATDVYVAYTDDSGILRDMKKESLKQKGYVQSLDVVERLKNKQNITLYFYQKDTLIPIGPKLVLADADDIQS